MSRLVRRCKERTLNVALGYDLERGRLDRTHHPFCGKLSMGDVRITTRTYRSDV